MAKTAVSKPAPLVLTEAICPWLSGPLTQLLGFAREDRLGHAWLIQGTKGVGKVNLALAFAYSLLGRNQSSLPALTAAEFSNAMADRHAEFNHHADLHWVFPPEDKNTIGIEQIRAVCEALTMKSFSGAAKVVVVEPAESMTTAAANALLKTLEEPTAKTILLLVSHRPGQLPATVRSRCQQLTVHQPAAADVADWLAMPADSAKRLDAAQISRMHVSPLALAQLLETGVLERQAQLSEQIAAIGERTASPIAVADEWAKLDVDHTLEWLSSELRVAIRQRFLANASNLITESRSPTLHNTFRGLALRSLFARLDEAETLRNQLAGGINIQLALRALLLGFRPDKE